MVTILLWVAGIAGLLILCISLGVLVLCPFILSGRISREEEAREDARRHAIKW